MKIFFLFINIFILFTAAEVESNLRLNQDDDSNNSTKRTSEVIERKAQTLIVGKNNIHSLQIAFNLCENGDSIKIPKGVFISDGDVELSDKKNITILGEDSTFILGSNYDQDVLYMNNCENIVVKNIHFRHTNADDYFCAGGVINMFDCNNIIIENCEINGCGARGVVCYNSEEVHLNNNHIHKNSRVGVEFNNTVTQKYYEIFEETDTIKGLYFNKNILEHNGNKEFEVQRVKLIEEFDVSLFGDEDFSPESIFALSEFKKVNYKKSDSIKAITEGWIIGKYTWNDLTDGPYQSYDADFDDKYGEYHEELGISEESHRNFLDQIDLNYNGYYKIYWKYGAVPNYCFDHYEPGTPIDEYICGYYEDICPVKIEKINYNAHPDTLFIGPNQMHKKIQSYFSNLDQVKVIVIEEGHYDINEGPIVIKTNKSLKVLGLGNVSIYYSIDGAPILKSLGTGEVTFENITFLSRQE